MACNFSFEKKPVEASTLVSVTVAWSVPFDSGGLPVLGYKAMLFFSIG